MAQFKITDCTNVMGLNDMTGSLSNYYFSSSNYVLFVEYVLRAAETQFMSQHLLTSTLGTPYGKLRCKQLE